MLKTPKTNIIIIVVIQIDYIILLLLFSVIKENNSDRLLHVSNHCVVYKKNGYNFMKQFVGKQTSFL